MRKKLIHRGLILNKLLITTCHQAQGAPFIDECLTTDADGNRYKGYAILLDFYKRYAIVFAWRRLK